MTLEEWQKRSAGPSLFLSFLYTISFVYPIYWFPVSTSVKSLCVIVNYSTWFLFAADYLYQMNLASNHRKYFETHLVELVLVIVPFFRPLRALRALVFTYQAGIRSKRAYIKSIPLVVTAATIIMIVIMGAAVLDIERNVPGSHITNPSDALWWGLVTITTIGYGDVYPITNEGRLVAGVLIIFGVAMISTLTGAFAAWLLDQDKLLDD
jgi:voltage-gated potassium channel